jgi:hypothetical protein
VALAASARSPIPEEPAAFNLIATLAPLTSRLKADAAWHVKYPHDQYPACQEYADECEVLLTFVQKHAAMARFWLRLCAQPALRDETLNELRVAYFGTN